MSHKDIVVIGDVPIIHIQSDQTLHVLRYLQEHQNLKEMRIKFSLNVADANIEDFAAALKNIQLSTLHLLKPQRLPTINLNQILRALRNCTTLQTIYLDHSAEDGEALAALIQNESLKQITIESFDANSERIWDPISIVLSTHKSLRSVTLTNFADQLTHFGKILMVNKSIEKLELRSENEYVTQDMLDLLLGLKCNSTLRSLTLAASGAETLPLFEALSQNQIKICELTLDIGAFIEEEEAIGNSLMTNTILTSLDLHSTSDFNCEELKDGLGYNSTLRKLCIDCGGASITGMQDLCDALKTNSCLATLDFGATALSEDDITYIAEALKDNYALTTVAVDTEEENGIQDLVLRNRKLKSEARFKIAILSHNIARGIKGGKEILPSETWIEILGSVTHPGMEPFNGLVRGIFGSYSISIYPLIDGLKRKRVEDLEGELNEQPAEKKQRVE